MVVYGCVTISTLTALFRDAKSLDMSVGEWHKYFMNFWFIILWNNQNGIQSIEFPYIKEVWQNVIHIQSLAISLNLHRRRRSIQFICICMRLISILLWLTKRHSSVNVTDWIWLDFIGENYCSLIHNNVKLLFCSHRQYRPFRMHWISMIGLDSYSFMFMSHVSYLLTCFCLIKFHIQLLQSPKSAFDYVRIHWTI